jgi:hypothetical protein
MVRIPALDADGSLQTGANFMRQIDAPTAEFRAADNLGRSISQIGSALGNIAA